MCPVLRGLRLEADAEKYLEFFCQGLSVNRPCKQVVLEASFDGFELERGQSGKGRLVESFRLPTLKGPTKAHFLTTTPLWGPP